MRTVLLMLTLVTLVAATAFSAEAPATAKTALTATVASQARVNVDSQGTILSVFNTTDGSGAKPAILNIYCGDVNITITPAIQANLDKLSPTLDWKMGGVVYTLTSTSATVSPESGVPPPALPTHP